MNASIEPGSSPQRVVSLAPYLTESMVSLGLGNRLVGVTDSCSLPSSATEVCRVGTPKKARTADILRLKPDLVLANAEENPAELIEELRPSDLRLWVTFPRTVRHAVSDLRDIVLMYASESMLQSIVWLDRSVEWLEGSRPEKHVRVFCPRKRKGSAEERKGWETIGKDTYAHDLLSLCGAENVFSGKDTARYPSVAVEEVIDAAPELILLPGEPFPFSKEDGEQIREAMPDIPAVKNGRILPLDGRLLFWPGARLGEAIRVLPGMIREGE